jgi:putative membrane protein
MVEKKRDLIWLIVVLVVLIGILSVSMWMPWGGYMSGMMGMMGFGWGSMFLIPLAFLVLIVLGAYYLVTEFPRTNKSAYHQNQRPLEILKERYAKGEITREQYLEMKELKP